MNVTPIAERRPSAISVAPLQIEFRFRLDLPPARVFELVTSGLPEWFSAVRAVTWNHAASTRGPKTLGARSERVCDFGGKSLVESILEVDPRRRYVYSADMARSEMKMPLRDHQGSFDVVAQGDGSLITWRQHFRALWFVPTAVLRWQMRDKMMRPAIERLVEKYGGALLSAE